jgi:hypothetical protein
LTARRRGGNMLTADTVTDEQIKEAIAQLDTEIAILQAALKIKRGPLVAQMRERAAEIINTWYRVVGPIASHRSPP